MKKYLKQAVQKGIINESQALKLNELITQNSPFKISNLLIYFGGLIALGSVTFFITLGFLSHGYLNVLISVLIFGGVFYYVLQKVDDNIAKGVLGLYIVGLVPVFVYALMAYFGFWEVKNYPHYYKYIDMKYLILEISTIFATFLMLKKLKLSILVLPIAFSLWFMSMDIVDLFFGKITWDERRAVSIVFGFYTIIAAYFIEKKYKDYSFWLYIFGVVMFWSGLSLSYNSSEFSKFIYFLINLILLVTGIKLKRKVFLVFGTLGVILYLGHLSYKFKDSFSFVYIVSFFGLMLVLFGIKFKKFEEKIESFGFSFNKKIFYPLLVLPIIFFGAYIYKSQNKTASLPVVVICKNTKYFLKKAEEVKIENDKKIKKVFYIYKNQVFNSPEEFKRKYCK
ncbi:DUF2157 domain-containing protein [Caminibacter pacificus]